MGWHLPRLVSRMQLLSLSLLFSLIASFRGNKKSPDFLESSSKTISLAPIPAVFVYASSSEAGEISPRAQLSQLFACSSSSSQVTWEHVITPHLSRDVQTKVQVNTVLSPSRLTCRMRRLGAQVVFTVDFINHHITKMLVSCVLFIPVVDTKLAVGGHSVRWGRRRRLFTCSRCFRLHVSVTTDSSWVNTRRRWWGGERAEKRANWMRSWDQ